jgi:hypothetical protein
MHDGHFGMTGDNSEKSGSHHFALIMWASEKIKTQPPSQWITQPYAAGSAGIFQQSQAMADQAFKS